MSLALPRNASEADIKKAGTAGVHVARGLKSCNLQSVRFQFTLPLSSQAYRKLAVKHHPDKASLHANSLRLG